MLILLTVFKLNECSNTLKRSLFFAVYSSDVYQNSLNLTKKEIALNSSPVFEKYPKHVGSGEKALQ